MGKSCTAQASFPVIDFAGLEGDQREAIAQQVARAGEEWGFFHVVNHGVDPDLLKRMKDVSRRVFDLPMADKQQIKYDLTGFQGWLHPSLKKLADDVNFLTEDMNECFMLTHFPLSDRMEKLYPVGVPEYRSTVMEYVEQTKVLFFKIFEILLEQLGISLEGRRKVLLERVSMNTNFYPKPLEGGKAGGRLNAHTDKGFLTILLADEVPGLEIKKDGEWIKVNPVPGAFIVNIADSTEVISNGRYVSVEHRGSPNPEMERLSIAEFFSPGLEAQVGPLKEVLNGNSPPRYKTFRFGDHLTALIKEGLVGKTSDFKLQGK